MRFFAILSVCFIACSAPQTQYQKTETAKSKLIGTWYLNEWDLYNKIYFQDSIHVVFDNHIDTLYAYTYQLKDDTLFLFKKYQEQVNYNVILKLTDDSLIFANLLDKQGVQKYTRNEKK